MQRSNSWRAHSASRLTERRDQNIIEIWRDVKFAHRKGNDFVKRRGAVGLTF
jgi:hypothetical protein